MSVLTIKQLCSFVCICLYEIHKSVTLSWSLPCISCPGSEAHTAAGAAELSLQRNDQVSHAAQQRGAGMVSSADLVDVQLLLYPIKSRFTLLQIKMDWCSDPEARGREGTHIKPDSIS